MIEDKKLGLKIAENPTEAIWHKVLDTSKQNVIDMKVRIEIEENLQKLAESKLKH